MVIFVDAVVSLQTLRCDDTQVLFFRKSCYFIDLRKLAQLHLFRTIVLAYTCFRMKA